MNPTPILCSILLLIISFSVASASAQNNMTAYEALQQYNFPIGLLPNGVSGYELDNSTGNFKAFLNCTCTISLKSYKLKYKSTVSGVIAKDKLSELNGIKVKVAFMWVGIEGVTRNGDDLHFSVGIASQQFPVSTFSESPTCGCDDDDSVSGTMTRKFIP